MMIKPIHAFVTALTVFAKLAYLQANGKKVLWKLENDMFSNIIDKHTQVSGSATLFTLSRYMLTNNCKCQKDQTSTKVSSVIMFLR